ncbi:MAG: hypothetical protein ABSB70_00410 [Candidatus Velthaea sp.]
MSLRRLFGPAFGPGPGTTRRRLEAWAAAVALAGTTSLRKLLVDTFETTSLRKLLVDTFETMSLRKLLVDTFDVAGAMTSLRKLLVDTFDVAGAMTSLRKLLVDTFAVAGAMTSLRKLLVDTFETMSLRRLSDLSLTLWVCGMTAERGAALDVLTPPPLHAGKATMATRTPKRAIRLRFMGSPGGSLSCQYE